MSGAVHPPFFVTSDTDLRVIDIFTFKCSVPSRNTPLNFLLVTCPAPRFTLKIYQMSNILSADATGNVKILGVSAKLVCIQGPCGRSKGAAARGGRDCRRGGEGIGCRH